MKKYNQEDIRKALKLYIAEHYWTNTEAAKDWGIKTTYISAMFNGDRPIPQWLLDILGYERHKDTYYTKTE